MPSIVDQQFVAHLYAPAEGPSAESARRALTALWQGCALTFHMSQPIPGIGLPVTLGTDQLAVPSGEFAVAAQERRSGDSQAILRRHQSVWNLSVALVPPRHEEADPAWWRSVDERWTELIAEHAPHLFGEARLYLAGMDSAAVPLPGDLDPVAAWGASLPDVPSAPVVEGVRLADGVTMWEIGDKLDERPLRRFVLAVASGADPVASAVVWSRGDTVIPPLGRYLLHAAQIRYELRVWQRDDRGRELRDALETVGDEITRLGGGGTAEAELLRLHRSDTMLFTADLSALRHSVEVAADNVGRAMDRSTLLAPGGPFSDDADLATLLLERLDDEVARLGYTTDRAAGVLDRVELTAPPRAARSGKVFVVHGRDESARVAVVEFLLALGLEPVDWDNDAVASTGEPMPFLGQALLSSIPLAQAVIVVMTPDDIVQLHPDLHGDQEQASETTAMMQVRPNVLIELGMALAVHPKSTLLVDFGNQRPIADLGGFNYVRVSKDVDFRRRLGVRLRLAGCPVRMPDDGPWLTAGGFEDLVAGQRTPSTGSPSPPVLSIGSAAKKSA